MTPHVIFLNRFFAPDHSATSQILGDLAFDLASRGVAVDVIASRLRYDDPRAALPPRECIGGVRVWRVWSTRFGRGGLVGRAIDYLSFYLGATACLVGRARRGSVVVAMTDPPLISVLALPVARLRGARLVNWLQDVFPEVADRLGVITSPVLLGLLRRLRNVSLRGAALNVVIGERMAGLIAEQSGRAVAVIPNWALEEAEPDASSPAQADGTAASAAALRRDWGLGAAFVVGYSGNMGRAHRLDVLIDVAARLQNVPGILFLLVGDGAQRGALEARARDLGLGNVRFRPYQPRERLRASLTVPDLHVVSLDERMEGLIVPSKFVGVIALAKPVLCLGDPDGEIGSLVRDVGCGLAFDPGAPDRIAGELEALACDRSRIAAMAAAAGAVWHSRFRRRRSLDAWHDVLTSR
jgi:colanic acid biosynthesis glycosyl transferase WcaI